MTTTSRIAIVSVLSLVLVAGLATSASAGDDDKRAKKFCTSALNVDLQVGTVPGLTTEDVGAYAADTKKALKKLVKQAPSTDVKKSLKVLVKYYGTIADTGDLNSVEYGATQIAAVDTITEFASTTCVPLLTATT